MSLIENNARLHEFRPMPWRTVYATVSSVRLVRGWSADELLASRDDPPRQPSVKPALTGTVRLDKDLIEVIGAERASARELSFTLRPFSDWTALSHTWKAEREKWGDPLDGVRQDSDDDDGKRLVEYLQKVYEVFEKRPPTLFLYFCKADREFGNNDEFGLDCQVPHVVFDALAADVAGGKCEEVNVSFELAPSLSDAEHAPPGVAVTLGILRMGKHDEGSSRGWVERVSWGIPATVLAVSETDLEGATEGCDSVDESQSHDAMNADRQAAPNELSVVHREIQLLSRTVRIGFVLILVLLAIIVILR